MNQQIRRMSGRSGWSPEETGLLFEEARHAEAEGMPVKSVFDRVADITGRKPNSIRNYYYLKLKEGGEPVRAAFTPFASHETEAMLISMLTLQAQGRSVRSIAIELGGGDRRRMLRYQNKYRSVLRTDPALVREVMEKLKAEGREYLDPYSRRRRSSPRDISETVSALVESLSYAGADAEGLLTGLLCLSTAAARAASCSPGAAALSELQALKRQNAELRHSHEELMSLCRSFLDKSGMERIASLPEYAGRLERLID